MTRVAGMVIQAPAVIIRSDPAASPAAYVAIPAISRAIMAVMNLAISPG